MPPALLSQGRDSYYSATAPACQAPAGRLLPPRPRLPSAGGLWNTAYDMGRPPSLRRLRRRLLRAGPLLLFLALLPSLLYLDHWGEMAGGAARTGSPEHLGDHALHRAHCHLGPATCSDQAATAEARVLPEPAPLPRPALLTLLPEVPPLLPDEYLPAALTEPPRSA